MACISDVQISWASNQQQAGRYPYSISKILNGYSGARSSVDKKHELRLNETDFVFGMVARGIKEKGWNSAINAFVKLTVENIKLVLVGEGPEIELLKKTYEGETKIHFVGYASIPLDYISTFDVALLPSYYTAESLPTVIIEYLMCNKPIISSDIGAVREMLQTDSNEIAGLLIKYNADGVDEFDLMKKMNNLYSDEALRNKLKRLTTKAFLKFDMQRCVNSYVDIYGQNGK
jgi:glycosyltransferase involved in cell wall biosynthesis